MYIQATITAINATGGIKSKALASLVFSQDMLDSFRNTFKPIAQIIFIAKDIISRTSINVLIYLIYIAL